MVFRPSSFPNQSVIVLIENLIYNQQMFIEPEIRQTVIDDLAQFRAVAILGPRQVGKTTLAKSVIASRPDSLDLDLERHSHLAQLQDAEAVSFPAPG